MIFSSVFLVTLLCGTAMVQAGHGCCTEITKGDAAAILDIGPGQILSSPSVQLVSPEDTKNKVYKWPPCRCSFRSKSNFSKAISYSVYVFNDAPKGLSTLDTMKKNFETVSDVEELEIPGCRAFRVKDDRFHRLVALKGNVLVDILNPPPVELQKKLAAMILESIPGKR